MALAAVIRAFVAKAALADFNVVVERVVVAETTAKAVEANTFHS